MIRNQNNLQDNRELTATKLGFLRDLLLTVPYFQSLNEIYLRNLIEMGCRQHLEEGEILCRQGEIGNAFYIVLEGAVEAVYHQKEGDQSVFTFGAGQFFGEVPLILGVPYPTTMRATTRSTLFMLNHQNFRKLLNKCPGFSEAIIYEFSRRKELLEELKALNIMTDPEAEINPVVWIAKRIRSLFRLTTEGTATTNDVDSSLISGKTT